MVLSPTWDVPFLHRFVFRDFPVEATAVDRARVADAGYRNGRAEAARYTVNWLSATGSGVLLAALLTAIYLRVPFGDVMAIAVMTLTRMRAPLLDDRADDVAGGSSRGQRHGRDARPRVPHTGVLYPFRDDASAGSASRAHRIRHEPNVLFGSRRRSRPNSSGSTPMLITTANSTGGVMGMIDAQSIVVATRQPASTAGRTDPALRLLAQHRARVDRWA
jgi:lactate permease